MQTKLNPRKQKPGLGQKTDPTNSTAPGACMGLARLFSPSILWYKISG